jgi:inactivated superfamily I helicase
MADREQAPAHFVPQPQPEAEEIYRRWIAHLDEEFTRHQAADRRAEIVRDQLYQLYLGRPHGGM